MNILNALKNDENGFIVSAELVLVGTILVIGMIVGLTELSFGVNEELEDLGSAIGSINQFDVGRSERRLISGRSVSGLDRVDADHRTDVCSVVGGLRALSKRARAEGGGSVG